MKSVPSINTWSTYTSFAVFLGMIVWQFLTLRMLDKYHADSR